ncbi:hypothetical protein VAD58_002541 [Escherichia coli]|nr:hypothetical protein [Escherichia coli]
MALPLRDFYPIKRAADLLGCTVDDCIHWAITGYLRLHLQVDCAYGMALSFDAEEYIWTDELYDFISGVQNLSVSEREEILKPECEMDKLDDTAKRVYLIIRDYIISHNGVDSIESLEVREFFDCFSFMSKSVASNNFCQAISSRILQGDFSQFFEKYRIQKNEPSFAQISGFWALSDDFFTAWRLDNKIYPDSDNRVYMANSNFYVKLLVDKTHTFNIEDLFISKRDFIDIKKIVDDEKSNGLIERKYKPYTMSNMHEWSPFGMRRQDEHKSHAQVQKTERVSRPMRLALSLLIEEYCDEKCRPTKIAEMLTTLAKKKGMKDVSFSKDTITNWLKG